MQRLEYYSEQLNAYHQINDFKGAETYYSKAIKAKYPDPIAILNLADVLKAQQKYEEAIVEYNNYKKEMPSDVSWREWS
jgi:tetratricopeptide (TPR) repeat protein